MDILSKIAERDAIPVKQATKLVKRWRVMYGGSVTRDSRVSRKFYTYAKVRKLVARATRLGLDCYASPMMVRIPT